MVDHKMNDPAHAYVPQAYFDRLHRQARYVWISVVAVVAFWLTLIVMPPILANAGHASTALPIYTFFGFLCHQIPERSFHIFGHQLAVCSRCFGVYLGLLIGLLVYPIWRSLDNIEPLPRVWLILSLIPITVDWSLTIFGIWENTHLSRFITGSILGFACACYILPAIVEIKRNYSIAALAKSQNQE